MTENKEDNSKNSKLLLLRSFFKYLFVSKIQRPPPPRPFPACRFSLCASAPYGEQCAFSVLPCNYNEDRQTQDLFHIPIFDDSEDCFSACRLCHMRDS